MTIEEAIKRYNEACANYAAVDLALSESQAS